MKIRNEDIREILVETPEGHRHVRARIMLKDETELEFQEATVANLTRAFVTVKTHPQKRSVLLRSRHMTDMKEGYADWQLVED